MAKKRQPSISSLALSLQEQNKVSSSRVDNVEKDVRNLENTVLVIMEVMKRKGIFDLPKEKTITGVKSYAQEVSTNIESTAAKDILLKIYGFMTKNAEKEKREKDTQKGLKKEKQDERKRKYEKLEKKIEKKGKGFFGTVGSVLKWSFLGAIGAGIAGLVWLFKEEISDFGKKLLTGLGELGKSIVDAYESVVSFMKDMKDMIMNNSFVKNIIKWFDDIDFESITSSMINYIDKSIKSVYDSFSKWIGNVSETVAGAIKEYANNPLAWFGALLGAFGGPIGALTSGSLLGTKTYAYGAESYNKSIYGEQFYNKAEELINRIPGEFLKPFLYNYLMDNGNTIAASVFSEFPVATKNLDGTQRRIAIDSIIKDPKLREALTNVYEKSSVALKTFGGQDYFESRVGKSIFQFKDEIKERMDELSALGETRGQDIVKSLPEGYKLLPQSPSYPRGLTIQKVDGSEPPVNSIEDPREFARLTARGAAYDVLRQTGRELEGRREAYQEELTNKVDEMATKVRSAISPVTSAIQHPQIALSSATRAVGGAANKIADKASKIDYFGEMSEAYSKMQSAFDKMNNALNTGEVKTRFEHLLDKVSIGEDPSSPFSMVSRSMNRFGGQIKGMVESSKQTIMTDRSGGVSEVSPIPVRDVDLSDYVLESNYSSLF